jgi:hypothetical protein
MKSVAVKEKRSVSISVILLACCSKNRDLEESFSPIQIAGESEKTISAATNTKKTTIFVISATSIKNLYFQIS